MKNRILTLLIACLATVGLSAQTPTTYSWSLADWITSAIEETSTSQENLDKLFDKDLATEYVVNGSQAVIEVEFKHAISLSGYGIKMTGGTFSVEYKKGEGAWTPVPGSRIIKKEWVEDVGDVFTDLGVAGPFTIGGDGVLYYGTDKDDAGFKGDDGIQNFRFIIDGAGATVAELQLFGKPCRAYTNEYQHMPADLFSEIYSPDNVSDIYYDSNFKYSRIGDYGDITSLFGKWGNARWNIEPGMKVGEVDGSVTGTGADMTGMSFEYTFPSAVKAGSYGISSFHNSPDRVISGWKVLAKNESDINWTELSVISGFQFPFPHKRWSDEYSAEILVESASYFEFSIAAPQAYTSYRFEVTEDLNKSCLEMSAFALYEAEDEDDGGGTGIKANAIDNDLVVNTVYYGLDGRVVYQPQENHIYIVKKTYESQKQTTQKVVFKK